MKEGSFGCPGVAGSACDIWDGIDIEALVALEPIGSLRYRSRYGDGNLNGRSYGGQVLGQAMMAASLSAPEDRWASTFQLLFLRGADPDQRIDFEVKILQEGKRFSSRHISGLQGDGRVVLDAHATFCAPQLAPSHAVPSFAREEKPDNLPELNILPPALMQQLRPLGPYSNHVKPCMDFRIPDIKQQLSAPNPGCDTGCAADILSLPTLAPTPLYSRICRTGGLTSAASAVISAICNRRSRYTLPALTTASGFTAHFLPIDGCILSPKALAPREDAACRLRESTTRTGSCWPPRPKKA